MSFMQENKPDPVDYYESKGLTLSGRGKWRTTGCAFHGGSDSMRINTEGGGFVCMNCGAAGGDVIAYQMQLHGQSFVEATKELGCWKDDGNQNAPRRRPLPFPARDALEVIRGEALLCAVAASNVAQGVQLTDADRKRLMEAAGRIQFIAHATA